MFLVQFIVIEMFVIKLRDDGSRGLWTLKGLLFSWCRSSFRGRMKRYSTCQPKVLNLPEQLTRIGFLEGRGVDVGLPFSRGVKLLGNN